MKPFLNPIGFGAADFLEFGLAVLLVAATVLRPGIEPRIRKLAASTRWCILVCAVAPLLLRLALLSGHPIPVPDLYDEFSHLLAADTLRHFRLANPAHPMNRFFETFFVLQQPSYASIYPIGSGLALAAGWLISGHAWTGVAISTGLFCGLLYWMLRGWTTACWALAGGLLGVLQFGPLNPWMNNYWGGSVSACAGCLVFGALPRLRSCGRIRDALILGAGLSLQLLTRPFESTLVLAAAVLFLAPAWRRYRTLAVAAAAALPGAGLMLLHNHSVTGSWTTLPGMLSRHQYGVPTTFTFQPVPVPHRELTREQRLGYEQQVAYHGVQPDTPERYLRRFMARLPQYRFFPAPVCLALVGLVPLLRREWRYAWLGLVLLIFAVGSNFYPFFFPHYAAAAAPLIVLAAVAGLERLPREAALFVLVVSVAAFLLWYGLHLFEDREAPLPILRFEGAGALHRPGAERRVEVAAHLESQPGKLLVFVRYWPNHIFQDEWVYNAADIDAARVVWARDRGSQENQALRNYYPDRAVWLLEPDARPPKLTPYPEEPKPEPAPPPEPPADSKPRKPPSQPNLRFENVR